MALMCSKRLAVAIAANNGLKLSSATRFLPAAIEFHILAFASSDDLADLLCVSHAMERLVHGYMRGLNELSLDLCFNYGRTTQEKEDAQHRRQHLLRALITQTRRLTRLTDHRFIQPRTSSPLLIRLVVKNQATLRLVEPVTLYSVFGSAGIHPSLAAALALCPELRVLHVAPYSVDGDAAPILHVLRCCRKISDLCLEETLSERDQIVALTAGLPLTRLHLGKVTPASLMHLGSASHRGLVGLTIDKLGAECFATLASQWPQLPQLRSLRCYLAKTSVGPGSVAGITWALPALTSLHFRCGRAPKIVAPALRSVTLSSTAGDDCAMLLRHSPALTDVHLEDQSNPLDAASWAALLEQAQWPEMTTFVTDQGPQPTFALSAAFCRTVHWPQLKLLRIDVAHDTSPALVQALLHRLPRLETAHVTVHSRAAPLVENERRGVVCEAINQTVALTRLVELELHVVNDALLSSFTFPVLKDLELTSEAARVLHLESALSQMPALETLHIGDCATAHISVSGTSSPLALTSLHLASARLQHADFCGLLRSSPLLEYLDVDSETRLGLASLAAIPVFRLQRLSEVGFHPPLAQTITADQVALFLACCPALKKLECDCPPPSQAALRKLNRRHKGLTRDPPFELRVDEDGLENRWRVDLSGPHEVPPPFDDE